MLLAVHLAASSCEGEDKGEADLVRIPSQHETRHRLMENLTASNFFFLISVSREQYYKRLINVRRRNPRFCWTVSYLVKCLFTASNLLDFQKKKIIWYLLTVASLKYLKKSMMMKIMTEVQSLIDANP